MSPLRRQTDRMDDARYLRERALEFRNLAITTRDPHACQELHHLADLCADKAAILGSRDRPPARAAYTSALLREEN